VEKLKIFLEETKSDTDTNFEGLNFKYTPIDGPIIRTQAKLIKYKEPVQLALLIPNEE
jgi:hypothetical protein